MTTVLNNGQPVTTEAELNTAIAQADGVAAPPEGTTVAYEIDIAAGAIDLTTALEDINLQTGVTLDIVGQGSGATLDGENSQRGFFVYAGSVTIENLTLANMVAQGGSGGAGYGGGGGGGGGGAGLGGGLFVGANVSGDAGNVTLDNVIFSGDHATGGAGGDGETNYPGRNQTDGVGGGGGGGLGGSGGFGGGGGYNGEFSPGHGVDAGQGGTYGGGGGGGLPGAGGLPGGGGGHSGVVGLAGGGGGIGAGNSSNYDGGHGGFGGGGGGGYDGGHGSFGGGGGGGSTGGGGGFGGGGGGSTDDYTSAPPGQGGFGGGNGGRGYYPGQGGGGGGLGAGGDIFVQQGASLTIGGDGSSGGSTLGAGSAEGGGGADGGASGQAFGSAIFLDGRTNGGGGGVNTLTLGAGQTAGQTTTISGVIADEAGSVSGANGQGALVIEGLGIVDLAPVDSNGNATANTFAGGVTIDSGTLELGNAQAAGSGTIIFASGAGATLQLASGADPANVIHGFDAPDVLDLKGFGTATSVLFNSNTDVLSVSNGSTTDTLHFNAAPAANQVFAATADGSGGAAVGLVSNGETVTTESQLNLFINAIDSGQLAPTASGGYTVGLGGNIEVSSALEAINLASGDTLTIEGNGYALDGKNETTGASYDQRGLFVYDGKVIVGDLTIENMDVQAVAGQAALGGGLYVGAGANVSLTNVSFNDDNVTGGAGGFGFNANFSDGGGGGSGGVGGAGGTGGSGGGVSGNPGGKGGTGNFGSGGGGGGGGGGGYAISLGGGGGGSGGAGGGSQFGGGSGGRGGNGGAADGSQGGGGGGGGGGGLGAGGDIFVQSGGALSISGGVLSQGGAVGGTGGNGGFGANIGGQTGGSGGAGQGLGGAIFLQGTQSITLGTGQTSGETTTIAGDIADEGGNGGTGAGSLIIAGAGTVALTGDNSYTGGTTVEFGTLLIDGSTANSAVTVDSGGTLGGTGTAGVVTVKGGGTFAPGDPSTFTVASLTLESGSTFAEEIGGTAPGNGGAGGYDQTVVESGGTISLGGATLDVSLVDGFTPSVGNPFTIINNETGHSVTGTFAGLAQGATFQADGASFQISYDGGANNQDVTLTDVDNSANPTIQQVSGSGTLSQVGGAYTLNFGTVYQGEEVGDNLDIANDVASPADSLSGSLSASGDTAFTDTGLGAFGPLSAGGTTPLSIDFAPQSPGVFTQTITVAETESNAAGNDEALPGQTIVVTGAAYGPAVASLSTATVYVHQGDDGGSVTIPITISNTAPTNGYAENLDAQVVSFGTPVTAASGSVSGLAPGASNDTAFTATIGDGSVGTYSGEVGVALQSDGTGIDSEGITSLGTGFVQATLVVDNYANAAIQQANGPATLSQVGGTYTLDFGTVSAGQGQIVDTLNVANAVSGPADWLSGILSASGDAAFSDTGLGAFSPLAAGDTTPFAIGLDTTNVGSFTQTITLELTDSNPSGYSAALNEITLTVEGSAVACYCPGTLVRTPCGNKRVEKLQIGDEVMTASGASRPIKWIGRRSYLGRFVMGRKDILPVCIKAGALADNVPRRDLWISPNHAMFFEDNLDGVLIEAKDLVNGVSIVQAERVDEVEYFHIELDTHDVLIAEGALSESFIDDDSRGMFHNAHEYRVLYPAAATITRYCAPRLDEGYEVEAIRQRLAVRAGLESSKEAALVGNLRGHVDRVTLHIIEGWAQNVDHPEAPVCLDIYAGGRLIGQVLANRYREDLEHAGMGSGRHSFAFTPPAGLVFTSDAIEVQRSLDGEVLPRSAQPQRVRTSIAA